MDMHSRFVNAGFTGGEKKKNEVLQMDLLDPSLIIMDETDSGLDAEEAQSLIVNGFCKEVLQKLPMEFAVEAQKLVSISLEGSVG